MYQKPAFVQIDVMLPSIASLLVYHQIETRPPGRERKAVRFRIPNARI